MNKNNINLNEEQLVMISVVGEIAGSYYRGSGYDVSFDGKPFILPRIGGITYNVKIGDPVKGWAGDHIEPGVSTYYKDKDRYNPENRGYNILSCIGNEATVTSGDAKRAKGVVTGSHGGAEHVLIDFSDRDLDKLVVGDKIQIRSYGLGLKIKNFDDIKLSNVDPKFIKKVNPKINNEKLEFPVVAEIPPQMMGSGLGADTAESGDYDITLLDDTLSRKYGLDHLRFGDIVAIKDTDSSFGYYHKKGAVTVGVIVHSDCIISGHGPGVMVIATSKSGKIKPIKNKDANIGYYLKIGRFRKEKKGGKKS